jgi:outer membrane protein assembly factor BamE (lipoprotein component of BamABCDE complex)
MIRRLAAATSAIIAAGALISACTPTAAFQGYQAIESRPADVKVGVDTKNEVRARLGSPTQVSTFDPNIWFYMSQVSQREAFYRPRTIRRDVVAITFSKTDDTVSKVDVLTLADGHLIALNGRETPTRGRQLSILEQLLGNLGQGQLNNQQDVNPGTRPNP